MMVAVPDWRPPGLDLVLPSPVQELDDEVFAAHQVRVFLKRDDLIHPAGGSVHHRGPGVVPPPSVCRR